MEEIKSDALPESWVEDAVEETVEEEQLVNQLTPDAIDSMLRADTYKLCEQFEGGKELYRYLSEETDFFTAPASVKYHYSFETGLVRHVLNIYEILQNRLNGSLGVSYDSSVMAKVAMCCKLSKTNFYEIYMKNEKQNGTWVQVPTYKTKELNDRYTVGDMGFTSYMIASRFVPFTDEEITAICNYEHLANADKYMEINGLATKYPLVTLLYLADMAATFVVESAGA